MDLQTATTLFYRHTRLNSNTCSEQIVTQMLNDGWTKAALETGNLKTYIYDTLKSGEALYEIPANIVKVHVVRLLQGATLRTEMTPRDMAGILGRDGGTEIPPATPTACSMTNQKHLVGRAVWELRLWPAPDWSDSNGIELYCDCLPDYITDATAQPDVRVALQDAGLWWACFQLCEPRVVEGKVIDDHERFYQLFRDAIATDIRTSGNLKPLVMRRPPQFTGRYWTRGVNELGY